MKHLPRLGTTMLAIVACSMLLTHCSSIRADDLQLRRLLQGPDRCDHVIGMLLRYGVNNDSNTLNAPADYPLGPVMIPAADMGDLELISILRHAETVDGCGPSFDLVIKNCSSRDVCGSHVTLVGLLGRILPTSPTVTAKIDSIPAGQAIEVTMTLPIESLAMGNLNGQMIALNRVLAVIDSFDQFMESNEANNLRVFDLAAIALMSTTTAGEPATEAEISEDVQPQQVGLQSNAPQRPIAAQVDTAQVDTAQVDTAQVDTAQVDTAQVDEPASPSDSAVDLSSPDLRSAIDQFTESATTPQDAS